MRIAVANSKFASPSLGGGVTSLLTLLEGLHKKFGISVDAFQTPPVSKINVNFRYTAKAYKPRKVPLFHWASRELATRKWRQNILSDLDIEYDLIIGQDTVGLAAIEGGQKQKIPSILFIRSLGSTGYYQYHPKKSNLSNLIRADIGGKIQYPFVLQNYRRYKRAIKNADVVIANSEFTASKLTELFDISPSVIYPPITIDEYQTEYNSEGIILMVNPRTKQKGGDIFLKVAEMMSGEEFRLVGPAPKSIKQKARSLKNVSYESWVDNIKLEYAKAKVVVVPTQWDEPFGRVAAEAMTSGIPCVVSNKGGLPEVVGDTGYVVDSVNCVEEWYSAIKKAINEGYNKERIDRVNKLFSSEVQINRLNSILKSEFKNDCM